MLSTNNAEKSKLIAAVNGTVINRGNQSETLEKLQSKILSYVRGKDSSVPKDVYGTSQFESESGALSFIKYETYFGGIDVIRFSEPDDMVPGRSWVVEITSGTNGEHVMFGCRLYCYARNYDFAFEHSVPRIVRSVVDTVGINEYGEVLLSSPSFVDDDDECSEFINLLKRPARWRNIVAFSADENKKTILDASKMAQRTAGLAHVVILSPAASFFLSDQVGKSLSVFDRGVRVYRPGFSEDNDRFRHPLIFRRQIISGEGSSGRQFSQYIAEDCFRSSIERKDLRATLPSFVDVRAHVSRTTIENLAIAENGSQIEAKLAAEEQARIAAEQQAQAALSMALQEEEERLKVEGQWDYFSAQLNVAQARIEALERKLNSSGNNIYVGDTPTSYNQIQQWVDDNFVGKLALHPRVSRGLKEAIYEDVSEVCTALSMLANEYRQVMLGESRREDFDEAIRDKHFILSGSISESQAKSFGDEYYVRWQGKKQFLHGHIQKGNSRDERYCLRVYFFWDPEQQVIVIGWLPSHLKNRLT